MPLLYQDGGSEANPSGFVLDEIGLIDLWMSSEGQRDGDKETPECERGSGRGSRRCTAETRPPDGGKESIESDRDKWSVSDREKEI